jgi:Plasmid pRiA4b ORF-3-like protein
MHVEVINLYGFVPIFNGCSVCGASRVSRPALLASGAVLRAVRGDLYPLRVPPAKPVTLGAVEITPSAVSSELADAALASLALSRAFGLAKWIGEGKELAASGTLSAADATQACRVLGIVLPSEFLRGVDDVPELGQAWETGHDAGFIALEGTSVRGSGLDAVTADPEAALRSWLQAFALKFDLREEPCGRCLTVLAELVDAADGVASTRELLRAVGAASPGPDSPDDLARELQHALRAVSSLLAFAAAVPVDESEEDDRVRLTPLGRMLAETVFTMLAIDPGDDVETAVTKLADLPPTVAKHVARPWLAPRTPAGAVGELLAFAESASTQKRMVAVSFAKQIEPEEAEPWRAYAGTPGFGALAREWLASLGEEVTADPRDEAWLTVETISVICASRPPEDLPRMISSLARESELSDLPTIATLLRASGHPDADLVADMIGALAGPRPSRSDSRVVRAAGGSVYQLKIVLRGVSDPPVWRRVLVPAGLRLRQLGWIIEAAMGWDGWHQHMFTDGSREYPDTATLRGLLSKPGDALGYTYDFGDGWEHRLELEDIMKNDAGVTIPACLDGSGACPPEDCGGPWGYSLLKSAGDFDPAAFSVEAATGRLSKVQLAPGASAVEGSAAVVRIQPRGKKKKAKRKR